MATYKLFQNSTPSPLDSYLKCDICGSDDIVETRQGYVCRDCACVLEVQKLQYDRPYNEDLIQYAMGVGKTQIGNRRERLISPTSIRLQRINKYNSITTPERTVVEKHCIESSRIFAYLDYTEYTDVKEMVLDKFKKVRSKIRPGSKYRNVEKLTAIIIYLCLKIRNIPVNTNELIGVSKITKKEFNDFLLQVKRYLPEYDERNRQKYILKRILEISEHFNLEMPFYRLCQKIFYRLWQGIKNTTDNVVAGLVSSISVLCTCKEDVSISAICNHLGIRMSTIQAQVKKRIFKRFKVDGFTTLVKSSGILTKIMEKLGLLEVSGSIREEVMEVVEPDERVDIVLGNATKIFHDHNDVSYYFLAVKGECAVPLMVTLQINDDPFVLPENNNTKSRNNPILEFLIHRFYREKDPPCSSP